jgi:flavocytochrome c
MTTSSNTSSEMDFGLGRTPESCVSYQTDVAIIGSGYAGLAAAIEAATLIPTGKILIIEKNSYPGGNSIMNAGQIAAVGSEAQKLANIEDSVELMMTDLLKAGTDLNHPNLIRRMIEESNDIVKWMEDDLGIEFRTRVTQLGGHSVPRTLSTLNARGSDIIDPMLRKIATMKHIEILLDTAFEKFIVSENGRRVEGIRVQNRLDDHHETLFCRRGVVIASGGFSADVQFRSVQNPSFGESVMTTNQPGATAEVLKEALKVGAMSVQLSRIQLGPWTSPDEMGFGKAPFFCLGAGFPYGIIVDPFTSRRFVNELGNRYERSMAILKMGHPVVNITDLDGAEHSLRKELEELEPTVKSFSSIEELAAEYEMDPDILTSTLIQYNMGVAEGIDAFGKPLRGDLKPITTAPFYAVRLWPKVHHTMGGLHINTDANVMHIDNYPIENLYAAGEVAGGVHGGDRLGSCATLDCLSFGRIAGHNVVMVKDHISTPVKYG